MAIISYDREKLVNIRWLASFSLVCQLTTDRNKSKTSWLRYSSVTLSAVLVWHWNMPVKRFWTSKMITALVHYKDIDSSHSYTHTPFFSSVRLQLTTTMILMMSSTIWLKRLIQSIKPMLLSWFVFHRFWRNKINAAAAVDWVKVKN